MFAGHWLSCVGLCVQIVDSPRFDWRGALLDVGRHYFSVPFIYKFLDVCAFYKINKFHWHLTEDQVCMPATHSPVLAHHLDLPAYCRCNPPRAPGADTRLQCEEGAPVQGWRIEIKAFPKLTEFGSWRGRDPDSMYGGFYTQEQVRGLPPFVHTAAVSSTGLPAICVQSNPTGAR